MERSNPPAELTPAVAQKLTATFKATGESVWQIDYIKRALAEQSHNKCSFCECELGIESKYLEVEHFAYKGSYPEEVVAWDNLIAACRRCNGKKGVHDVRVEPIVNPYANNPRDHIRMQAYRLQSLTPVGDLTISVLGLNDIQRAMTARFKIGAQIGETLEQLKEKIEFYKEKQSALRRAKVANCLDALLNECLKRSPYAATAATVLHRESIYPELKEQLIVLQIWTVEFQELHDSSLALVLQKPAP
ncbi:hypothetical protein QTI05_20870 [Variovorax sp. J22R193]|uniref:hypothetical protein n=1 Tax=Variovorax fucosicus TaxID=3053517 RepID=UPI0025772E91|nr:MULTISPECIES: hypothetical protein [unclassified Variovorax]MDM0041509.1 hypothetical protein [Variovorax sp. J22R193]